MRPFFAARAAALMGAIASAPALLPHTGAPVFDFLTTSVSTPEGNSGTTIMPFVVRRFNNLTGTDILNYAVAGFGPNAAQTSNFPGGVMPSGTLTFVPGDTSKTIYIVVATNAVIDVDRDYTLTLSGHPNIIRPTAFGTILNDDSALPAPGSTPPALPTTPTVRYHPNSQSATLSSGQVTACPDLQGLADASGVNFGGTTIGPVQMTDALGRKFWAFNPGQALIIANALNGLNSRAISIFMVGRQHKVTRGMDMPIFATRYSAYTNDTTNTARNNGYPLRVQCNTGTSEVARLKSGTVDSSLGGTGGKMIPGAQLQVIGLCSRTTANGGLRFYINNDVATDGSTQSSLTGTADIGAIIGGKATSSNGITGTSDTGFDLYDYVIVKGTLTNAQADAIVAALVSGYNIPAIDSQLILLGDSVTECIDTSTTVVVPRDNMAVTLTAPGAELVPTSCRVINAAIAGSALADPYNNITGVLLSAQRDNAAGPLIYVYPGGPTKNVITCNVGINDMRVTVGNQTAAAHYANFVALLNTTTTGYLQRGFSVVAVTPTAISGDGTGQSRILAYRDLMVDATTDVIVDQFLTDCAANTGQAFEGRLSVLPLCKIENGSSGTVFLTASDAADTLYYAGDGTHHTPAAMQLKATGGDTPQYGYAGVFDIIVPPVQFSLSGAVSQVEGNTGLSTWTYTIFRTGNLIGTASVDFNVLPSGTNPMPASRFSGGVYYNTTVNLADGEDFKDVTFTTTTDTIDQADETFMAQLSNPTAASGAAKLTAPYNALGTSLNDDAPTGGPSIIDLGGPTQTEAFIRSGYGAEWTAVGVATQTKKTANSPQELLTHWNTIKAFPNTFAERWEIECNWDSLLTYGSSENTYLTLNGIKGKTQCWADLGGWVKIYAATGKRPSIANRVKGATMRGVEIDGVIFGGRWDGAAGKQSVQRSFYHFANTSYPAEAIINIRNCAFGRSFVDSTQSPDYYITAFANTGLAEQVTIKHSSVEGAYFGLVTIARKTSIFNCDLNKCNGDYTHFFGHTFKTGYHAYVLLENLTLRGPIQLLAYRNLHQDMYQTGSKNDKHLGYRVVSKNIRANMDHMYNGDPGAGGGSQGSYNDDYNNADNLFCLINDDHHAASPHSFAYWSPKATYCSYVYRSTFGRCGRVPSQFPGDVYTTEDFDPGITGNANKPKIPGVALKVIDCITSRQINGDPQVQNSGNIVFTHTVGGTAGNRPEDLFTGRDFTRGGAAANFIANKFGYQLPNELGTQQQFVADMAANWTPIGSAVNKGAYPIVANDFSAVDKPAWAT